MDRDEKIELIGDVLDILTEMSMGDASDLICDSEGAEKVMKLIEDK